MDLIGSGTSFNSVVNFCDNRGIDLELKGQFFDRVSLILAQFLNCFIPVSEFKKHGQQLLLHCFYLVSRNRWQVSSPLISSIHIRLGGLKFGHHLFSFSLSAVL